MLEWWQTASRRTRIRRCLSGRRRTFTAKYKLEILAAYDAAGPGEKGAILRREGLYTSHIVEWRRARDAGALAALAAPRGRKRPDPRDAQIAALRKEKERLEQELARARFVIDVQAKLQALLDALQERGHRDQVTAMTDQAVAQLAPVTGTRAACAAAGAAQASWYRRHRQSPPPPRPAPVLHQDRHQPRALDPAERQAILDVLHSGRPGPLPVARPQFLPHDHPVLCLDDRYRSALYHRTAATCDGDEGGWLAGGARENSGTAGAGDDAVRSAVWLSRLTRRYSTVSARWSPGGPAGWALP